MNEDTIRQKLTSLKEQYNTLGEAKAVFSLITRSNYEDGLRLFQAYVNKVKTRSVSDYCFDAILHADNPTPSQAQAYEEKKQLMLEAASIYEDEIKLYKERNEL